MLRYLLEEFADKGRVRRVLRNLGVVQDIPRGRSPLLPEPIFDIGLETPNPRTTDVLALRQRVGRKRDGGNRVLHPIVKPSPSDRQVVGRRNADTELTTAQALRSESGVP